MAKCVTNGKKFLRVPNERAKELVEKEGYRYCSKDEWKRSETGIEEEKESGK